MTKIWINIEFEGPTDPEELFSCIEVALVELKQKKRAFAATADDEPIKITNWDSDWESDGFRPNQG